MALCAGVVAWLSPASCPAYQLRTAATTMGSPGGTLHALTTMSASPTLATLLVRSMHFLPPPQYPATGAQLQQFTLLGTCFNMPTMVSITTCGCHLYPMSL